MNAHAFEILLDRGDSVSARLLMPEKTKRRPAALLALAHGAGNDMHSPFLSFICEQVAVAGIATLKFNFPYKEKGRKPPDPTARLEDTWRAVLDRVRSDEAFDFDRIFAGGKSLGGRMASRVVAEGEKVDGLVFLGYPLHPPGIPQKQRTSHFPDIDVPALFVQGTRDRLCDLDLLRKALPQFGGEVELYLVEGGDHSFNVPKRSGVPQVNLWRDIVAAVAGWIGARTQYPG